MRGLPREGNLYKVNLNLLRSYGLSLIVARFVAPERSNASCCMRVWRMPTCQGFYLSLGDDQTGGMFCYS